MSDTCPEEAARIATEADLDELTELREEARRVTEGERGGPALLGRDHPRAAIDRVVEAALTGESAAVVVVIGTLDEVPVGYMLADTVHARGTGRVARLLGLWVTPEARQMGVGEAMMGELLAWARAADCVELDAEALPGDRDTKNFFETHGLVARQIRVSRPIAP